MNRDIEDVHRFLFEADRLRQEPLTNGAFNVGLTIQFEQMKGLSFQLQHPEERDLRSLLLQLRRFVAQGDPTNLGHVHNVAFRAISSDTLRGYLAHARKAWRDSIGHGGIRFMFDDQNWTPEYVADLWIDGWYFHANDEKLATLQRLAPPAEMLSKFMFLDLVSNTAKQVMYVSVVLRHALSEGLVHSA